MFSPSKVLPVVVQMEVNSIWQESEISCCCKQRTKGGEEELQVVT
jgi:hypothetical protein